MRAAPPKLWETQNLTQKFRLWARAHGRDQIPNEDRAKPPIEPQEWTKLARKGRQGVWSWTKNYNAKFKKPHQKHLILES